MSTISKSYRQQKKNEIPNYLIYEVIDGIPVYYKGYKEVLAGNKKPEGIMGYGEIQALLVTIIRDYYNELFKKEYWVLAGESGVHLDKNNNLATDIAFYPKKALTWATAKNKYINIPAEVVIEIDTKADPDILEEMNYYTGKTQKLLDFGVKQVIWVYTDYKKVTIANKGKTWLTMNWEDDFTLLNHTTSVNKIIDAITNL